MGSPTIFSGRRTKFLTADGGLLSSGRKVDYDGAVNLVANSHAETGTSGWSVYDDGAVAVPVDMTGGAPSTITLSRTTTAGEVLSGVASFKIVKTAADGQGEGWSVLCTVPEGYRGKQLAIKFPFKLISGTLASGDLNLFGYDVTNSLVLDTVNGDIVGSRGSVIALFSTSTSTAQIRVGFHLATTAATAFTISWDDFEVVPTAEALGTAATDWKDFTPVGTWVANTTYSGYWRRVGDSMEVQIRGNLAGAPTAATLTVDIPSGYAIDTNKLASGNASPILGKGSLFDTSATASYDVVITQNDSNTVSVIRADGGSQVVSDTSPFTWASGDGFTFLFTVPISGWSSNVSIAGSSTFKMSNILANGTRVTATPTRLGEYRSKIKTASSNVYSAWTDDAPGTAPSAANGFRIYALNYATAGTAGQTNAVEMFVGRNKTVRVLGFKDVAFANAQDITRHPVDNSAFGLIQDYDPTAGVLYVSGANTGGGTTGTSYFGWDANGSSPTNGYIDVVVSENALAVGVQAPRSELLLDGTGTLGNGSTDTRVTRFGAPIRQTGTAFTYATSAANGSVITINEDGIYSASYLDQTSGSYYGVVVNSAALTTDVSSQSTELIIALAGTSLTGTATASVFLRAGDVVRCMTTGTSNGTGPGSKRFLLTKVSN